MITYLENKQLISNHNIMQLNPFFLLILLDTTPISPTEPLPSYEGVFLKMLFSLLLLVLGVIATVWFTRRMTSGRFGHSSGKGIKILEKKVLSPKTMLYLIEVQGRQIVLAESHLEIQKIISFDTFSGAEEKASTEE
jgi:flagellar biogenesis protein FliO